MLEADRVPTHHLCITFLAWGMSSLLLSFQGYLLHVLYLHLCSSGSHKAQKGNHIYHHMRCLIMAWANWCLCQMEATQNHPSSGGLWESLGCQYPLTALMGPSAWTTHPGCAGRAWLPVVISSQPYRKSGFYDKMYKIRSPSQSAALDLPACFV